MIPNVIRCCGIELLTMTLVNSFFQSTLDFIKAVDIFRARESARKSVVKLQSGIDTSQTQLHVNLLNDNKGSSNSRRQQYNRDSGHVNSVVFCGGQHSHRKCPAFGKPCAKCGMVNHFAKVCEQSPEQQTQHGFLQRFDKQPGTVSRNRDRNSSSRHLKRKVVPLYKLIPR